MNVGRRARVVIFWILVHHLELGLNSADLSACTLKGGKKKRRKRSNISSGAEEEIPVLRVRDELHKEEISSYAVWKNRGKLVCKW